MTVVDCSSEELFKILREPFPSYDIEWRISRCWKQGEKMQGFVTAYVTNRAIQQRLDKVFGPDGWKNEFKEMGSGVLCHLSCKMNGEWITKVDGSEYTNIESFKGGLSQSMKRAAVQFGIGRYLYRMEEVYVEIQKNRPSNGKGQYVNDKKQQVTGYFIPPELPKWALSDEEKATASEKEKVEKKDTENQNKLIKPISQYLELLGFNEHPDFLMPFFKNVNPNCEFKTPADVLTKSRKEDLQMYYTVLKPAATLVNMSREYKVDINQLIGYVQILYPENPIKTIFECIMPINLSDVKEIKEMLLDDLNNKGIA